MLARQKSIWSNALECLTSNRFQSFDTNVILFQTRIHLLNRNDGSIWPIVYQTGSFAFFHTINAYEDDDHVVVDICCYRDAGILKTLTAEAMQKASSSREEAMRQAELVKSQAMRFVLPLHPSQVDQVSCYL